MPNQIPNWFDFLKIMYLMYFVFYIIHELSLYRRDVLIFFNLSNHTMKLIIETLPKFNSAAKHMGYMISAIKRDTTETHTMRYIIIIIQKSKQKKIEKKKNSYNTHMQ